mgnify:CR=1 FL=1
MNIAHIRRYTGIPVIVQLRDAMALGSVSGPMQASPVCDEEGRIRKKDGTLAAEDTKQDEVAYRPAWPIAVRRDAAAGAEFRYAIENAMVSVHEKLPVMRSRDGGPPELVPPEVPLVHIHYTEDNSLFELVVEPEAIVGITCVRQGPMAEEKPSLIVPGRN